MPSVPEQFSQQWIRRFRLGEEDLVMMTEVFPDLEDPTAEMTLDQICQAIVRGDTAPLTVAEALRRYKERQEFSAARRLLDLKAGQEATERRDVDRLHEQAMSQLEHHLTAARAQVGELGKLSVSESEVDEMKSLVDQCGFWLRRGRIGKVNDAVTTIQDRVERHILLTEERLLRQIQELRSLAETTLQYDRRALVERLLGISQERLRQKELRLAENACERAAIALQGGELPAESTTDVQSIRRVDTMRIAVATLLDILETDSMQSHRDVHDWEQFVQTWEISQLRSYSGRNVREALQALYLAQSEPAMKLGEDAPWPKFLRKFLECLVFVPALGGFQQLPQNMGAFAPLNSRIGIPGSFFEANPEVWKVDPLILACKQPRQPATLVQQLVARGTALRGRLALVFVSDTVAKQHRDDLRTAFNTQGAMAVLLDQQMILSILCAADPQERSLRFVATLARQLPEATINPFRSDNAVSDGMFFGREKEIHDLLNSPDSFAVFGGRKLGKTSLLRFR